MITHITAIEQERKSGQSKYSCGKCYTSTSNLSPDDRTNQRSGACCAGVLANLLRKKQLASFHILQQTNLLRDSLFKHVAKLAKKKGSTLTQQSWTKTWRQMLLADT